MRLCAIVDAYTTGRFLAAEYRRHGWDCVHVQSAPEVIPHYRASFQPGDFARNIVHDGSAARVAAELAALRVRHVEAGAETGVDLAESLAAMLGLPGNDPALPGARRDKAVMAHHLRRRGLDAPDGICTRSRAAAVTWAVRRGQWPVVAKPVASAATDHVLVCTDGTSLARAFDGIVGARNVLGRRNEAVLVQEFLAGTEFVVNSVSRAGRHHVAEVWRYVKRPVPGGSVVYDFEETLPAGEPLAAVAAGYVRRALDALGVRSGPAHSELMLTARGPVLLETGARLPGMVLPQVMDAHFGVSQVRLAVRAVVDPEGFDRMIGTPYVTRGHLRNVFLISHAEGVLAADEQFRLLSRLPSFAGMSIGARAGARLRPTDDLWSSPGHVYLAAEDADAVAADHARIRELEATVLYPLAPRGTDEVRTAAPPASPARHGSGVGR